MTALRVSVSFLGLPRVEDRECHVGPLRPADQRRRAFAGHPLERALADGRDQVAAHDAGALGRRPVEDLFDPESARVLRDGHADAREAAVLRLLEAPVLRGREVAGEAILELVDRAGDRIVGELVARNAAVVARLDAVERLVDDARGVVAGQHVGDRVRERLDMTSADPRSETEQQHGTGQGQKDAQRGSAAWAGRHRGARPWPLLKG